VPIDAVGALVCLVTIFVLILGPILGGIALIARAGRPDADLWPPYFLATAASLAISAVGWAANIATGHYYAALFFGTFAGVSLWALYTGPRSPLMPGRARLWGLLYLTYGAFLLLGFVLSVGEGARQAWPRPAT
jgi:hypothetical protein